MHIIKKKLPNSIIELTIEQDIHSIAKYRKDAIKHIKDNTKINGFRKGGNIPDEIVERQVGQEKINALIIDFAIDDMYKKAIKQEGLIPVKTGEIKEIVSQDPLKIIVLVEVFPEVSIEDKYKKISLKRKDSQISDEEVDKAIKDIEIRFSKFEKIDNPNYKCENGDRVTIDADGYENGKKLDDTSIIDYPLILGSKILVPGFEEKLIGFKSGDNPEIDIVFPKNYHNKNYENKKVKFKVKIKSIEKVQKPEFNEQFIEQLRGKKLNFKEFRDLIAEELKESKIQNNMIDEENELIDELIKISSLEIGNNLLQSEIEKLFSQIKENMSKDGIKMSDYLQNINMDEEKYKETQIKKQAQKRLKGQLILNKLLSLEKIEISQEEIQKEIEKIMSRFQNEEVLNRLKKLYENGSNYYEELKLRLSYKKLINCFFN